MSDERCGLPWQHILPPIVLAVGIERRHGPSHFKALAQLPGHNSQQAPWEPELPWTGAKSIRAAKLFDFAQYKQGERALSQDPSSLRIYNAVWMASQKDYRVVGGKEILMVTLVLLPSSLINCNQVGNVVSKIQLFVRLLWSSLHGGLPIRSLLDPLISSWYSRVAGVPTFVEKSMYQLLDGNWNTQLHLSVPCQILRGDGCWGG